MTSPWSFWKQICCVPSLPIVDLMNCIWSQKYSLGIDGFLAPCFLLMIKHVSFMVTVPWPQSFTSCVCKYMDIENPFFSRNAAISALMSLGKATQFLTFIDHEETSAALPGLLVRGCRSFCDFVLVSLVFGFLLIPASGSKSVSLSSAASSELLPIWAMGTLRKHCEYAVTGADQRVLARSRAASHLMRLQRRVFQAKSLRCFSGILALLNSSIEQRMLFLICKAKRKVCAVKYYKRHSACASINMITFERQSHSLQNAVRVAVVLCRFPTTDRLVPLSYQQRL